MYEYGIIEEHKVFKGITDSRKFLDSSQFFEILKSNKIYAKLSLSWKKRFDSGFVVLKKASLCTKCKKIQYVMVVLQKLAA